MRNIKEQTEMVQPTKAHRKSVSEEAGRKSEV